MEFSDGDSIISDDFDSDESIDISDTSEIPSSYHRRTMRTIWYIVNSIDKIRETRAQKLCSFWMSYYDMR